MNLDIKDKIEYAVAVLLVISGISIAFLSAIFNAWNITTGVLIYIAQAFVTAGGIFGVSIYFKSQIGEFRSELKDNIEGIIEKFTTKDKKDN